MEYMPGEEFSVDCFAHTDNFICVTRRRDVIKDGICSEGETIYRKELIEASYEIIKYLNLSYNINLQFRYDKNGKPKLLEINPRLSGTIELCRGAGVNFPAMGLKKLKGQTIVNPVIKWNTKMTRVWNEIFEFNGSLFEI